MDRLCKVLLVVLFLAGLFLPATGWLAGWRFDAPLEEKRTPTPWPTLQDLKADAPGAAKAFENAFADRYAFRSLLIKTDAWLNWRLFGISTTDNVAVGRDGWLFFTGDRSMPLFQGLDRFTDADAAYVADVLEMRHHWLRDQGIACAHVVAPAKESVYPEFMPPGIPRVKWPSCMEEFIGYGRRRNMEGQPVDLLSVLTMAKASQHPLYLRGDTHWNDAGALIAYREILQRLGQERSGLPDSGLERTVEAHSHPAHDLATMLGIPATYCRDWPNDSPVVTPKGGWSFRQTGDARQRLTQTTAAAPHIDQRLLCFGDSFAGALLPFMAETFASVTLFQGQFFSPSKVGEFHPDVVLIEGAERLVFHVRPAAAEETRLIHSPVWERRMLNAVELFDSAQGWQGTVFRPKQPIADRGPIDLRIGPGRARLHVPVDLGAVTAGSAVAARLQVDLPADGVLRWQFLNSQGEVGTPSWLVQIELRAGRNDVSFGLPARGTAPIDHLHLSLESGPGERLTVEGLRVVALPSKP